MTKHLLDNFKGCLIGAAIGDALGYPVEFLYSEEIKDIYGSSGVTDLFVNGRGAAEVSDDTQMTIFTAEGLLKSIIWHFDAIQPLDIKYVYDSYQDWLTTQSIPFELAPNKGWVSQIKDLYVTRAPGMTCLESLENGIMGTIENPINSSKGCGGVMRVAPAGLIYYTTPELAFRAGAECAALTHGNPSGYLPAGVHACLIAYIIKGLSLEDAVDKSILILQKYAGYENTLALLHKAKDLSKSDIHPEEAIKLLGGGWCGDKALAIGIYCALKSPNNFKKALLMSVNHDGDSDSTGSITGGILGAYLGIPKISAQWKKYVELKKELSLLAKDLFSPENIKNAKQRYLCR